MYQDKEKQREANREKARRHRERNRVTPGVTPTSEGVTTGGVTPSQTVTPGVTPELHTKDDVNPWGWPKYDSEDRRINPATMKPYGPKMAEILGYSPESITEYERKRVRKDILVIHDLPRAQVDAMYRALVQCYSHKD
jgi:hypothetical protein